MLFPRLVYCSLGCTSIAGTAPYLDGMLTSGGPLSVVAVAKMVPAVLLGVLYVVEALLPKGNEDVVEEAGSLALHITAAALALVSIALDLFTQRLPELGHALHTEAALIALYVCVMVMSLVRVWIQIRRRRNIARARIKAAQGGS